MELEKNEYTVINEFSGKLVKFEPPLKSDIWWATRCQILRLKVPNSLSVWAVPQSQLGKLTSYSAPPRLHSSI